MRRLVKNITRRKLVGLFYTQLNSLEPLQVCFDDNEWLSLI